MYTRIVMDRICQTVLTYLLIRQDGPRLLIFVPFSGAYTNNRMVREKATDKGERGVPEENN